MTDRLDVHTHTLASGHAYNTICEMAQAAAEKGIELLGITEHAPRMPGTCSEMYFLNLHVVPKKLYDIELMLGCELNILDSEGTIDLPEHILEKMDICIASIHPPCFLNESTIENNTKAIINAIRNPYVQIIGHPDDSRFPLDYDQIVQEAKEHHVLLELNNSSLAPYGFRVNAKENIEELLRCCKKYQASVVMGSDAHVFTEIGNHVYVKEMLDEIGFPKELVANRSVDAFKQFINMK